MPLSDSLAFRLWLDMAERLDGALAFAGRLERMRLGPDGDAVVQALNETLGEARGIVGQAVDVRRAQTGALDIAPAPVRLRDVVDQIEERWRARAQQAGVTLLTAYDGEPDLAARLDGDRLAQCLDGLIAHALSRGAAGAVEAGLSARVGPDGVVIDVSVRDSAANTRASVEGDLALSLVREVVAALGGEMRGVDNPGAGETLAFRLLAPSAEAVAPERQAVIAHLGHVLIVDDNATNRMVAEALCDSFDCTSETACDGFEAIEAMRSRRFDVVLMDIKMPNMDGMAATAAIRAMPDPAGRTPILAMTANADPGDIARYLAAGMQGVIEKPIKPERLAVALEAVLLAPGTARETSGGEALEAAGASPYNPASSRIGA